MNNIEELKNKEKYNINDLKDIMKILRSDNGCPWDRVQTHKTIRQDLLEEAYETAEAIDEDNDDMLIEELGDVLLQVVFHSRIAEEEGRFSFNEVCSGVCKKLVERHPHVFGDITVNNVEDVLTNWDNIKQNSKNRDTLAEQIDGICKALPALMLASKYVSKCMKNGIEPVDDFTDDKVTEEEIGEELFRLVAVAKRNGIDPELALQRKCAKFKENIKNEIFW